MGWQQRDSYLGPHRDQVFDGRGNARTTAWVDGRVVGGWVQDGAGVVRVRLPERVSVRARRALEAEASRMTAWLGRLRIGTGYVSPAMTSPAAVTSPAMESSSRVTENVPLGGGDARRPAGPRQSGRPQKAPRSPTPAK
jgi:Winged helix DNA-binding domain